MNIIMRNITAENMMRQPLAVRVNGRVGVVTWNKSAKPGCTTSNVPVKLGTSRNT
jgi:hypothetical protein